MLSHCLGSGRPGDHCHSPPPQFVAEGFCLEGGAILLTRHGDDSLHHPRASSNRRLDIELRCCCCRKTIQVRRWCQSAERGRHRWTSVIFGMRAFLVGNWTAADPHATALTLCLFHLSEVPGGKRKDLLV